MLGRWDSSGSTHLMPQLSVPVPVVPDGGVGAVVKRELGAFLNVASPWA